MLLKDKRIFCIEDNPVNFAIIRMLLAREGAFVYVDNYGDVSLSKLDKSTVSIDVILLDLMLHNGVSGYTLFDEIKKSAKQQNVPVIAVSAADADVEIPRAKELGLNGFISKPIDPEAFAQQVAQVLDGQPIWQ